MAAREGFFETNPAPTIGADVTSLLNAIAVGATAIVGAGGNFVNEFAVGDILTFVDTAGERQYYTISLITDGTNLTIAQAARSISGVGTAVGIATFNTNYVVVRNALNLTYPLADPVLGQIGGGLTSGHRMNAPSLTGGAFIDSISPNEGINLKTLYIRNPYQHTWGQTSFMVSLFKVSDTSGAHILITQFGVNGTAFIPMENTETSIDVYIPPLTTGRWGLAALISNSNLTQNTIQSVAVDNIQARLSNINVPVSMDGLILPIVIGVRFTYGLTITA